MLNLDNIVNKNNKDLDKDWPFRMLIIGPLGSGKTNALLNFKKNLSEHKYEFLINNREKAGIKNYKDPNAFIEYSNTMDKIFEAVVKELFIRCRKLNICLIFITQSYFRTPKDARLNSTHYLLMKIHSKKELQNIGQDNSGDTDFKDFLSIYRSCTKEPHFFDY